MWYSALPFFHRMRESCMGADCYAIIMAGGRGERFWPLSSELVPKPFVSILGEKTMIRDTVDRLAAVTPPGNMLVVLSPQHLPVALEQLPDIPRSNFIVEPMGRDTAACIGLASLHVEQKDAGASVVIVPADQRIPDRNAFAGIIAGARDFLGTQDAGIITIGIRPIRPETGYGYIETGAELGRLNGLALYRVSRFVEKPDPATAQRYCVSETHYWNSGIFVAKNKTIQDSLRFYMPGLWAGMERIRAALGTAEAHAVAKREFAALEKVSIDYGVLEKSGQVTMVPAQFAWDDLGTWNSLARVCIPDADGNVAFGRRLGHDTRGCIIYNAQDQLLVTMGVRDLVVVQARGKVLICHKDRAPFLKEIMPLLAEEDR
jgi:mannose-1-phosphate guanylyltransferase